ncbi:hypothetical protein [Desulfobacterium sp. N47]|uniref:Uncharacterized protein n=1 Tax=uncultured Desulfobacterium sp. TaxID=201089 RepID=E1YAC8_9BACT|nr:unknown protein [uncultured Desulfobacterium sp.]
MFTEREKEILTKLASKESMYISDITNDPNEIENIKKKLKLGSVEYMGTHIKLTQVGRDCFGEILKIQNG